MAEIITVTALNRYARSLLESDAVLSDLAVRGEIRSFRRTAPGHLYFLLKDAECTVQAVMFSRSAARLSFEPQDGMNVIVRGRIGLYEKNGSFQIYVDLLVPDGRGAAMLAFEQLKSRLEKEGLFAREAKKPLPAYPQCIGLVTSKYGAAVHDILAVAGRRWPSARFLLAHAGVQGEKAEDDLVSALQLLVRSGLPDVIIITRGGGSAEDLWVFNGEKLARAAAACPVPIVSAVGHEVDFTILDFVADCRASTPTAAAELVLPDAVAVRASLENERVRAKQLMRARLQMCYNSIGTVLHSAELGNTRQLAENYSVKLNDRTDRIRQAAAVKLERCSSQTQKAAAVLDSLSPYRVLARGYCVAERDGHVIAGRKDLQTGDRLSLQWSTFGADAEIVRVSDGGIQNGKITEL